MLQAVIISLVVISCFMAFKVIIGPSVWDRLLGFNLMSSKLIMVIVLFSVLVEKDYLLDLAITYALLGFVSIVFIAGFIQKKGRL